MYNKIIKDLKKEKNQAQAKIYARFFKTGKGEYGEGDVFWGLKNPQITQIAKKYFNEIKHNNLQKLLDSKIHEQRMCAVKMMRFKQEKLFKELFKAQKNNQNTEKVEQRMKENFEFYLKNAKRINNWDLVDVSAPQVVGNFLFFVWLKNGKQKQVNRLLTKLAQSANLWERRIAVLSTLAFIKQGRFTEIIKLSKMLLNDKHDLMHKAVGWMLREVGKKDKQTLINFLDKHTLEMPRTMLRYAIEKLPEKQRLLYLNKKSPAKSQAKI